MKTKLFLLSILIIAASQTNAQQALRRVVSPALMKSSVNTRVIAPRKLSIEAVVNPKTGVRAGERTYFTIMLRDNNNQEVAAISDVAVEVLFTTDERRFTRMNVKIPAGSSRITISHVHERSGILHVKVMNSELLEGSTFVKVLGIAGIWNEKPVENSLVFQLAAFVPQTEYPFINVSIDTAREYLADGIDEVEISLSLEDPDEAVNADSILVSINPGGGYVLQQDQFYLNRIGSKKFKLVSKRRTVIRPHINVHNLNIPVVNNDAKIKFVTPIDFFTITAGPADIHLLNRSEIIVTLFNKDSIATDTDRDMRIDLFVLEGDGSLLPDTSLIIRKGTSGASGVFMPNSTGKVIIMGNIASLANQILVKPIEVSWPRMVITVIFIGGFLGSIACLLYKKSKGIKNWLSRIVAGGISGVVLYLLYVTGIYKDVFAYSNIHLAVVCLLAIAGGYMGEDVMIAATDKIKGAMKLGKQIVGG